MRPKYLLFFFFFDNHALLNSHTVEPEISSSFFCFPSYENQVEVWKLIIVKLEVELIINDPIAVLTTESYLAPYPENVSMVFGKNDAVRGVCVVRACSHLGRLR